MLTIAKVSMLVLGAVLAAASPSQAATVQPMLRAPMAIIEGGTVSTLPKSVKSRGGRIVVLRGRADRAQKPKASVTLRATTARAKDQPRDAARTCACTSGTRAPRGVASSSL